MGLFSYKITCIGFPTGVENMGGFKISVWGSLSQYNEGACGGLPRKGKISS